MLLGSKSAGCGLKEEEIPKSKGPSSASRDVQARTREAGD